VRKFFILLVAALLFFPVSDVFAFATKGQNCSKCHTLKKEEAITILQNLDQNIKILNVNPSPVKYLWEVSIESRGKKGLIYIDFPKKHIFSGSLITVQGKKNLTRARLSELKRVNVSKIPLKDSLVLGEKYAKHKVIVFDDPD